MLNFANFMGRIVLFSVLLFGLATSCTTKLSKIMKSKDYEYKYKMAEQYYASGKYPEAQKIFEDVFPFLKGSTRYEDMYFKYAYSYYYNKDYLNAENLFKTFVENFPASTKSEECEYMRAYCYFKHAHNQLPLHVGYLGTLPRNLDRKSVV